MFLNSYIASKLINTNIPIFILQTFLRKHFFIFIDSGYQLNF